MIDWDPSRMNDPQYWMRLADSLMQKAIADIQSQDKAGLKELQKDFGEFAEKATLACPVGVLSSVNTSSRQVATALVAIEIGKLDLRTAKLDAAGAKVSVAAAMAKSEAGLLRLDAVRQTLGELDTVAVQVREFRDGFEKIPKSDVAGRIDKILEGLLDVDSKLRAASV